MSNFIESISIGTKKDDKSILLQLAQPTPSENKLIVLAGKNRSGKSHILNEIERTLKQHNKLKKDKRLFQDGFTPRNTSVALSLTDKTGDFPGYMLVKDLDFILKKSRTLALNDGRRTQDPQTNPENVTRRAQLGLLCKHLKAKFGSVFDEKQWLESKKYRQQICDQLNPKTLYRCLGSCQATADFEQLTQGYLYYRFDIEKHTINFFLKYPEGQVIPNQSWSMGQRALFIYLCYLYYLDLKVLMIDEIENYLHPEYISYLCEKLKQNVPQVIVSTHNPHVIFSKLVNQCWYIELDPPPAEAPEAELNYDTEVKKKFPSFTRRIEDLSSNFSKVSHTYKLFNGYDNNLLRLSQSSALALTEKVTDSLFKVFSHGAVKSKKSNNPDLQNDKLGSFIQESIAQQQGKKLKVLDLGAGYGRTFFEVNKISGISDNVEWSFWEPFDDVRAELSHIIAGHPSDNLRLIENEAHILPQYYDLVVVSNVLHECTPDDFAQIIQLAATALNSTGYLVVIELYPLLHPEKYAVPYSERDMKHILRQSGFSAESTAINIKNSSVSAYWVKARKNAETSIGKTKEAVLAQWKIILKECCADYNGIPKIESPDHVIQVMAQLTTMASIQSYDLEEWR